VIGYLEKYNAANKREQIFPPQKNDEGTP